MTNPSRDYLTLHLARYPILLWFMLALFVILLIAGESFALYTVFTSKFPSGNDFFVRWLGGREYLLNGTNPFDRSVAEKAQTAMFGRLAQPEDKDQAYFAYPLYTLYFYWPLSLIPYAWAQAVWMTLLQFMLLGSTILALRLAHWRPPIWLFWFTAIWGIFFYNGARAILLGQFSIVVTLSLYLALWAVERQNYGWAGIFLSVTTIKPQMIFLLLIFLLLWALLQQRWRLIGSFTASLMTLIITSMFLVPSWPDLAAPLTVGLSVLFFLTLLPGWWLALRGRAGGYTWAVMSTLIVGSLITFRSATTNQVILFLPLFFFFRRLCLTKSRAVFVSLIEVGLLFLMWAVFVATLDGNWEHVMMHGLLPALMLLLYTADWRTLLHTAQDLETSASFTQHQVRNQMLQSGQV
jgi:hypothetical protein